MEQILKKYIVNFAVLIICGTFCFSAVNKILYWSFTLDTMQRLLLNDCAAVICSILLILLESMLAISIFFKPNYWKYIGCFSAAILIMFTSIVLWGKAVDRITECPCFGKFFGGEIGITLVIRNGLLIMLSILLAVYANYAVTPEKID